jgi:hypothetical protein
MRTEETRSSLADSSLLVLAAERDPTIARTLVAQEFRRDALPAELLPAALRALDAANAVQSVAERLWRLFGDQQRPMSLRLQAAELLARSDRKRVTLQVYAELGGP